MLKGHIALTKCDRW